jgi:guanylate kinase
MLYVISAPSGAGKTTIIRELFKQIPGLKFSVSATTRKKRHDEIHGKDYYFLTEEEFNRKISGDEFAEWEEVHGNKYGTLKSEIEPYIEGNAKMILDVDVKGALNIKKKYPSVVLIFIYADEQELIGRLKKRNTESEDEITRRIMRIREENVYLNKFDYIIENNSENGLEDAIENIKKIILNN